ncbi:D-amino-acid transaminase [Pseudalkalibacillus caeni]|uniref:D-alanine aminotransferase n=1 Tax=Exobacillus caeni TaxID=2574798 RepID=A0A5R9F1K9_9BACL|nr:D-amino-acid transaminase [Pseudalkalibacillus caeni]TLS37457.1 D-amino-acid transaminase [Pseudalkalibacillus caeni]
MIIFQNKIMDRSEVSIDIEDRGYQFGDGVYEVIRIYDGKLFEMEGHMKRLERSAGEIELSLPFPASEIIYSIKELIKHNNIKDGHVYMQITRGASSRNHPFPDNATPVLTAYTKEYEENPSATTEGIKALLADDIRWLRCDIKSLNLLGNVLGKQKAKDNGYDETIFHRGDTVTEGSSTNVFIVNNGQLVTHPATNLILNGITRKVVIDLAQNMSIPVREEEFTIDELLSADEVFITSTTIEVAPVTQINNTVLNDGKTGEVTRKLQEAFKNRISKVINKNEEIKTGD